MLIHLYSTHDAASLQKNKAGNDEALLPNGHARTPSERQAQDVQEFELEGLMSDDEDDMHNRKMNGGV